MGFEPSGFDAGAFETESAAPDGDHGVFSVNVRPKKRTSHLRPSFFAPVAPPAVPAFGSVVPARAIVTHRRAHLRPSVFRPAATIADSVTPPIGPAGAATFAYAVESDATITYEWPSVVRGMWSGIETRASLVRTPRQHFEFSTLLSDAQMRTVLATMMGAASAPTFLLGLPHEELHVKSSTISSVTVESLALCDWAAAGQRIVVVGQDGTTIASTWISGTPAGVVIPVGSDVSALALEGARIMPAIAVKLDPEQGFERQRVGVDAWRIVADAAQNGYGATTQFGVGASVATHDGIPVWDRGNQAVPAAQPMLSGAARVDSGTDYADAVPRIDVTSGRRAIRIESSDTPDWQWLKAFLMAVRGRSTAFLLPTGRPDLVAVGDASSGSLIITGVDYVTAWFPSLAHRRIRVVFTDGSYAYRTVTAAIDNGNGTQTLTLAAAAAGTIERVELLELVRLASDAVSATWRDYVFDCSFTAQVVQQ